MEQCIGGKYILNEELKDSIDFNPDIFYMGTTIYEVIRIIHGTYLFLEEHLDRLNKSANAANTTIRINRKKIVKYLFDLKDQNQVHHGNVKLAFTKNHNTYIFAAYCIESIYPSEEDYLYGISTILVPAERVNPNVKIVDHQLREMVDARITQAGVYEALLVNQEGYITEGNKSNVFFVKGGEVYTPPLVQVLPGITRNHVMSIGKRLHIAIYENKIQPDSLAGFNAAFLTGTSPKVLPIKKINDMVLGTQEPLVIEIMKEYDKEIERYIYTGRPSKAIRS